MQYTFEIKIRDLLKNIMIPKVWNIAASAIIIIPISKQRPTLLLLSSSPNTQSILLWVSDSNLQIIINCLGPFIKFRFIMLKSQYKNYATELRLLFQKNPTTCPGQRSPVRSYLYKNQSQMHSFKQMNWFASKKPKIPEVKARKVQKQENKNLQESQFLWKLNIFFNVVGMGVGFYFPQEGLMFVLTSNFMIQFYESSKSIRRLKQLTQNSPKYSASQMRGLIAEVQQVFKNSTFQFKIVKRSSAIVYVLSISVGLCVMFPYYGGHTLNALNLLILFNLKFNKLSQSYYLALLSLLGFQYLYFQGFFGSNYKVPSLQRT